jgi:hypothetical protein
MAFSFGIVRISNWPTSQWQTKQQTSFAADDEVATFIEPETAFSHATLQKYRVRHEQILHFEGRYKNDMINEVIRVTRFAVYVEKNGSHAYVLGNGKVWRDAFRRMRNDPEGKFDWEVDAVDLNALVPLLKSRVAGGWFGKLDIPKVKSAGIFGPDVSASDDWDRYDHLGELSAVNLELPWEGEPQALMLCNDWTLVFYRDLGEVANIDFAAEVRQGIEKTLAAKP